jgi:acyl carrier protein
MNSNEALEIDLKRLIVEVVDLEDLKPEDIGSDTPLFNEGLGFDSIDALEIGMAVAKKYGIKFGRDQDENTRHFRTVKTLAELIQQKTSSRDKNQ